MMPAAAVVPCADIAGVIAGYLDDDQYLPFASVSTDFRDAYLKTPVQSSHQNDQQIRRYRTKTTRAITADTTARQLDFYFKYGRLKLNAEDVIETSACLGNLYLLQLAYGALLNRPAASEAAPASNDNHSNDNPLDSDNEVIPSNRHRSRHTSHSYPQRMRSSLVRRKHKNGQRGCSSSSGGSRTSSAVSHQSHRKHRCWTSSSRSRKKISRTASTGGTPADPSLDLVAIKRGIMTAAAREGHVNVVRWARSIGAPWDARTLTMAAQRGHLGVVMWGLDHGCPANADTCAAAAAAGRPDLIMCLARGGVPWDARTCAMAAQAGSLVILKYVRRRGCPWDSDTCYQAASGNNLAILRWAIGNGCPMWA